MINKGLGTFETLRITEANELFYVGAAVITNSLRVYFISRVDFINKERFSCPVFHLTLMIQ